MKNLGLMIVGIGSVFISSQATVPVIAISGTYFIIAGVWIVAREVFHEEE